jgi:hypothetical protein
MNFDSWVADYGLGNGERVFQRCAMCHSRNRSEHMVEAPTNPFDSKRLAIAVFFIVCVFLIHQRPRKLFRTCANPVRFGEKIEQLLIGISIECVFVE